MASSTIFSSRQLVSSRNTRIFSTSSLIFNEHIVTIEMRKSSAQTEMCVLPSSSKIISYNPPSSLRLEEKHLRFWANSSTRTTPPATRSSAIFSVHLYWLHPVQPRTHYRDLYAVYFSKYASDNNYIVSTPSSLTLSTSPRRG